MQTYLHSVRIECVEENLEAFQVHVGLVDYRKISRELLTLSVTPNFGKDLRPTTDMGNRSAMMSTDHL